MQRVLSFTHNGKKYISKPFDFKAACLIEEKMFARDGEGELKFLGKSTVCSDAVDYLFEGTEATQDILNAAVSEKIKMCREVHGWFVADWQGNETSPETETETAEG